MFLWQPSSQNQTAVADRQYFLNTEFNETDPLITSVPSLKDMIKGPIISTSDPSQGDAQALLNIVEFSDYQCQYCQKQEEIIKEVIGEYEDKIKLIWKDLPDGNIDSYSFQASIAGRCANEQGKFWEYHDLLFKESDLTENNFISLAEQLKLDMENFRVCLKDNNIIKSIYDNILEAEALDITGVPFIFINDQEVMGEITEENLKQLIDIELNKQ